MGLKLRHNLFYGVQSDAVYRQLRGYWSGLGRQIREAEDVRSASWDHYRLYQAHNRWVTLRWDGGWEWQLRREAQLHVSRNLGCAGLLVFVYDGDYWGYELFDSGQVVDQFVQWPEYSDWFDGKECSGNPELIAATLPNLHLNASDVATYLVPAPDDIDDPTWDVPARAGDQFTRGDECAVIDFLRLLDVGIGLHGNGVQLDAPAITAFTINEATSQS